MSKKAVVTESTNQRKKMEIGRANFYEPNVYMVMAVTMEGDIAAEELIEAVKKMYSQNETTMSKMVLEENGELFFEKITETGCKVFVDNRDWQEIMCESERDPFKINEGEFVRTYIIPRNDKMIILMMAHHIIGDGKSCFILIDDIISNLEGKEVEYKPMELMSRKFLSERASLSPLQKIALKFINHKWKKTGKVFTWEDYFHIHKRYWHSRASDIVIQTFEKSEVEDMKKTCKKMGVTINSFLIAKLLQEYPDHQNVGLPVSIREENRSISYQITFVGIEHRYNENKTFEENVLEIHKKIYEELGNNFKKYALLLFSSRLEPTLHDSALMYRHVGYENPLSRDMAVRLGYIEEDCARLGVTNLGNVKIQCKGEKFRITDVQIVPPQMSYAKSVVAIHTYQDKLRICYHNVVKKEKAVM